MANPIYYGVILLSGLLISNYIHLLFLVQRFYAENFTSGECMDCVSYYCNVAYYLTLL